MATHHPITTCGTLPSTWENEDPLSLQAPEFVLNTETFLFAMREESGLEEDYMLEYGPGGWTRKR